MSNLNLFSVTMVVLIAIFVITGMAKVGSIVSGNDNLNDKSIEIIDSVTSYSNLEFDESKFEQQEATLNGTSIEGVDAFEKQYLEEKIEGEKNTNIYKTIIKLPRMLYLSLGLPDEWVEDYEWIINTIVGLIVIVVGYVLFFGRGKIDG